MNGKVQEAIDWHTAKPTELDGARCILMTQAGTTSSTADSKQATRTTATRPSGSPSMTPRKPSKACGSSASAPNTTPRSCNPTSQPSPS